VTLYADTRRVLDAWTPPDTAQADVLERFQKLFTEYDDPTARSNPGAHITASTLVVSSDHDRVLLCLHGRVGKWLQLGGHCEPVDQTLAGAALREATEESGVDGLALDPVPVNLDVHSVQCRTGPSLHYDIRFVATAPPGAVPVVSAESRAVAWFAPEALPEPLGAETTSLIGAALRRVRGSDHRPGSSVRPQRT
jgi:ADP-ribose pyrophosphatase YjhB (NUDIX family)